MRLLKTSEQTELQEFIQHIDDVYGETFDSQEQAQMKFWAIELKPKRRRITKDNKIIEESP